MNFSIIAGLGPLGTPELIILSILIGIVAIPILAVIAVVVFLGLTVQDFGTAAHLCHGLVLGVPTHHSEALIPCHYGAQQHPIAGFKNMKREHFLGEEHHVG
jgi:hypothetical protein